MVFVVGLGLAVMQAGKLNAQGAGQKEDGNQAADKAALKQTVQSLIAAIEAGDARAMAAHWTENGEYLADDGTAFRGRVAIEKEYLRAFAKRTAKVKAEFEVDSIRFPSKDTAIEEGYFKVRVGKDAPITSKFSILHVREGGQWLMAVVREWPNAGVVIRDLDWLIGSWAAKNDDVEIQSTYKWWGNKTFIRGEFSIKQKDRAASGFQMIGRDPATGDIRSWAFDPDGSFGEGVWTREGKKWFQESAGVLPDGTTISMTNIITQLDHDAFTFQSVDRTVGGEDVADLPPVRVNRVKTTK